MKYIKIKDKIAYQITVIDLAIRYTIQRFMKEIPLRILSKFMKQILNTTTYKIQIIQPDNGMEFTYRYLETEEEPKSHLFYK